MESFYSVLYYQTNPLTDEKLAIGLFLGGGEGPFFKFSEKRLHFLKSILHKNTFNALNRNINALKSKVDEERTARTDLMLFDPTYTVEEFKRMNQKLKGALLYSEPTVVNEWADKNLINQLAQQFLGEKTTISTGKKRKTFHLKWLSFCRSKTKENWKKAVELNDLNASVAVPVTIDLLHVPTNTLIKGIDFDLSTKNVQLKYYAAQVAAKELADYSVVIVYASPKTKSGKKHLENAQKSKGKVEWLVFNDFVKRYK